LEKAGEKEEKRETIHRGEGSGKKSILRRQIKRKDVDGRPTKQGGSGMKRKKRKTFAGSEGTGKD